MVINAALTLAYNQLSTLEGLNDFWSRFDAAFGNNYDAQRLAGDFSPFPPIKVVSDTLLGNAFAAYNTESNTVYLSDSVFKTVTLSALNVLILKEMGHFVEAKVNQSEYPGEAGKLFAQEGQSIGLSSSAFKTIPLQQPFIAAATPVVYETITLSLNTYSYKYSGSNVIWVDSKGSNSVLKLYNGSSTTAIANSAYSSISDYSISGSTVVYAKQNEIYRYSAGTTTKLTNNTISDYAPQIDGSTVVWYANDGTDVEIFRNNGTTTTQLTNNSTNEYDLKLSGTYAVWAGWDGNDYEIYLNNGTTTTQLTNNSTDDYNPILSGNQVAWLGWNGTAENLFYYNGSTTSQVTSNLDVYNPKISGDKLVYSKFDGTNYSLQLYNGTSKTTTQLSSSLYNSNSFKSDGNSVAWEEKSTIPNSYDVFLKLYNGTSTANIATTSDDFTLAGNKVAYVDYDSTSGGSQIFLYDGTLSTPTNTQITAEGFNYDYLAIVGNSFISQKGGSGLYLTRPSTKPILSINNVTVVEGQTAPQNAVLVVTLSAASTVPVTVQYTTSSGSADDGSDYTTTTGTLSFAAGELSKNISVPILNDDYSEYDETFTVKLSNAVGAVFVPNQNSGTVTITDTLQASVTTILPAGIENLTLTGTANINGTGNSNDNKIQGNSGNNVLDGQGGYDQLIGGAGNDTYIVSGSSPFATITENANEGIDTVQYSPDYSNGYVLEANLENLILTGTYDNTLNGNSLDNVITGNSSNGNYLIGYAGNDTLNGGGGNDTLIGGTGNDIYIVDSTGDFVGENANEGTDTIQSSVTFSLATFPNIENLTLTGSSAINGTGNTANNSLTGNTANNLLSGDTGNDILTGAAGKDTLTGGAGIDKFGYKTLTDSLLGSSNNSFDLITDFNATTGNDLFLVTTARAGFTTGLTVATLDTAGIGAKLTTTNFAANYAAQFTFTSGTTTRTFVAINDATAGFNASTDSIVEVTGLTGTLVIGNFVTA